MDFVLHDRGWDRLLCEARAAHPAELRIVCPFIKRLAVERLLTAAKAERIQVITRFNLRDFLDGVSDTAALRLLMKHGAKVRGIKNLHAKMFLFDGRRAVVTSANLTDAALRRNHEFGFASNEEAVLKRCEKYFDDLWGRAGDDLTFDRIAEWEVKLEAVRATGVKPSSSAGLSDEGENVDIDTQDVMEMKSAIPSPLFAEPSQAFVKFFGSADRRVPITFPIYEEVKRSGCHWACTYPASKRPRSVMDGAVMFMGRLTENPNDTLIYGWAIAQAYRDERDDATQTEIEARPFKERWSRYIRVHHAQFIAGTLANGVSLSDLMDELDENAFATTKLNAATGNGNTNPRKAFSQQPAVELSPEGIHWLTAKLMAAFANHGKLSPVHLERLDWPEYAGDSK